MWPVLARSVFPLKAMLYEVNDYTDYPQVINTRNAMGQREMGLNTVKLCAGKIKESTHS